MTTLRSVVDALGRSARDGETVVLATVVRVVGSSYGGVGARLLVRVDGSTVGLVSGGCLESDLALHARRVHDAGVAQVVAYDTRADDDAVWGLGLGCNGLVEVLLEPLAPARGAAIAALLSRALAAEAPAVLATVVRGAGGPEGPAAGAHALVVDGAVATLGDWGRGDALAAALGYVETARAEGRRGAVCEHARALVAFENVTPAARLVVCGSGPDVVPVVAMATQLGWDVTVLDHRPLALARPERFPGARVVECADALRLGDVVPRHARTAAVVMSHHFGRDADYVQSLVAMPVAYVGVLGPRPRTERLLAELAARGAAPADPARLHGPIGLDLGGDGPEAIALAIVAEVSAVLHARPAGHLRDRQAPLHAIGPGDRSVTAPREGR